MNSLVDCGLQTRTDSRDQVLYGPGVGKPGPVDDGAKSKPMNDGQPVAEEPHPTAEIEFDEKMSFGSDLTRRNGSSPLFSLFFTTWYRIDTCAAIVKHDR